MALRIQTAKFKIHQYQLRIDSPIIVMLAEVSSNNMVNQRCDHSVLLQGSRMIFITYNIHITQIKVINAECSCDMNIIFFLFVIA